MLMPVEDVPVEAELIVLGRVTAIEPVKTVDAVV
jgi:hypothetical protein